MTAACNAICAICYEDARPITDDLVSISQCGHVFHDLCLQQWLEYTPRGRKATCPLCKRECSSRETHRLYFQSAADTAKTRSPLRASVKAAPNCQRPPVDEALVIKLEGQLSTTKAALVSYQEQLKDLDSQLSEYILRVDKAEAARSDANRERAHCKEAFSRAQEELKRSMLERSMLLEKNISMAKELAAHKLIGDTDLAEEDVLRLASVGRGSNKEDIIDTLTKSLILRNRTYKDLMARCNELGISESRAVRACEKAIDQSKKLKAKVQELERKREDQDNARLRSLATGNTLASMTIGDAGKKEATSAASCRERLTEISKLSAILTSGLLDQDGLTKAGSFGTLNSGSSNYPGREAGQHRSYFSDVHTCKHPVETTMSAMSSHGPPAIRLENGMVAPDITEEQVFGVGTRTRLISVGELGTEDLAAYSSKASPMKTSGADVHSLDTDRGGVEICSVSQILGSSTMELHSGVTSAASRPQLSSGSGELTGSGLRSYPRSAEVDEAIAFPLPIRREVSLSQGSSPRFRTSAGHSGGRASVSSAAEFAAMDECVESTGGSSFKSMCKIVHHDDMTASIPLDSRKICSSGLNSVWQGAGIASGKYIATGADGRGGRVTVLKPSHVSNIQGLPGSVSTPSKPGRLKRSKLTDVRSSTKQDCLRIEHFFGPVALHQVL